MKVRYLRLYIIDNHGGSSICFQGVRLHGADCRVFEILHSCQKRHLGDNFVEKVSDLSVFCRLIISTKSYQISVVLSIPDEFKCKKQKKKAETQSEESANFS